MMRFTMCSALTCSTRRRLPEGLDHRDAEEVLQPSHVLIALR